MTHLIRLLLSNKLQEVAAYTPPCVDPHGGMHWSHPIDEEANQSEQLRWLKCEQSSVLQQVKRCQCNQGLEFGYTPLQLIIHSSIRSKFDSEHPSTTNHIFCLEGVQLSSKSNFCEEQQSQLKYWVFHTCGRRSRRGLVHGSDLILCSSTSVHNRRVSKSVILLRSTSIYQRGISKSTRGFWMEWTVKGEVRRRWSWYRRNRRGGWGVEWYSFKEANIYCDKGSFKTRMIADWSFLVTRVP